MDDWVAFLNARLDDDRDYADDLAGAYGQMGPVIEGVIPNRLHMLLQRTAVRLLSEVQAKRAILASYLKATDDLEDPWVTNALLTALGHHMAVWDDHPDYPAARKSLEEAYWTP